MIITISIMALATVSDVLLRTGSSNRKPRQVVHHEENVYLLLMPAAEVDTDLYFTTETDTT